MSHTPSTGQTRFEKWKTRFGQHNGQPSQSASALLTSYIANPVLLARVESAFEDIYAAEVMVRQVLNGEGVSVVLYPAYLNFGREMWKLGAKGISGESAALEAQTLIQKWVARGLSQTVLEKLRTDVFSVPAPTP